MIVVCAATATEAAACRRGIEASGATGLEVLATGVGPRSAAAALKRRLARAERPGGAAAGVELVVSSGFAGALTGGLEPLAWITASAVHRLVGGRAAPVALPGGLLRAVEGVTRCEVLSADRVVTPAVAGMGSPAAVDMESAALAEVAAAAGVPFAVLRLVTDTPDRPAAPIVHTLAAALSAEAVPERARHCARAALQAIRSPLATAAFLQDTARWRARLRGGWGELARAGLRSAAVG